MLQLSKFIISIILIIGFQYLAIAQNTDSKSNAVDHKFSKFQNTLEAEFGSEDSFFDEEDDSTDRVKVIFDKIELPDWVYNPPASSGLVFYAIGISDPQMEKDSAIKLAILRAKSTLALIKSSKVTTVSDYFTTEKDLGNRDILYLLFKEFNTLEGQININEFSFNVEQQHYNNNKEAIVLLSYQDMGEINVPSSTIKCFAETFISHTNIDKKDNSVFRLEVMGGEISASGQAKDLYHYIVKKNNKSIDISSKYLGHKIDVEINKMVYKANYQLENDVEFYTSYPLDLGLWQAYITAILNEMVLVESSETSISDLNDQHTTVKQNIKRAVTEKNVSLKIKGIHIKNNELILEI